MPHDLATTDRDKRQHERVPFDAEFDVELDGEATLHTFGVNLSREGACFTAATALAVGRAIKVCFRVGEQRFALGAEVRHTTHVMSEIHLVDRASTFVVGVQFAGLSADQERALAAAVEQLRELDDGY